MASTAAHLGSMLIRHCSGRITSTIRSAFRMLDVATDGTQEATKFIINDTNTNQGIVKATQLHIGTSGSETQVAATAAEINSAADLSFKGETLTGTETVTAADDGKIFFLNAAGGFTATLPALSTVSRGWKCEFIVKTAPSGADYVITENGTADTNKCKGAVKEAQIASGTDHPTDAGYTFTKFVDGTAIAGDWAVFETDGTNWFVHGQAHATGGITLS